jgi:predicted molibdopterin-dependent oxidoreductase YjgC
MIAASARGDIDVFWMVGGNFLETLADVPRSTAALERPRLRVHQDIVLTSAMLVDPSEDVLVLPATTRYESPGGGTETSTERRIIFSPEIPGRRIGSARPEWQVMVDLAARVRPEAADKIRFRDAAAIRNEMARAIPLYAGIERLHKQGDQIQWGGPQLFTDGTYATVDGKAHFTAQTPRSLTPRPGEFRVSTRRGKQFNSMVQKDVDPLTGADRHDVLISEVDARRVGVAEGGAIRLISDFGEYTGRARFAEIKPGNLEVHWPEGAGLLSAEELDPDSLGPDYNADARVEVVRA